MSRIADFRALADARAMVEEAERRVAGIEQRLWVRYPFVPLELRKERFRAKQCETCGAPATYLSASPDDRLEWSRCDGHVEYHQWRHAQSFEEDK